MLTPWLCQLVMPQLCVARHAAALLQCGRRRTALPLRLLSPLLQLLRLLLLQLLLLPLLPLAKLPSCQHCGSAARDPHPVLTRSISTL